MGKTTADSFAALRNDNPENNTASEFISEQEPHLFAEWGFCLVVQGKDEARYNCDWLLGIYL
jgi:hypothetical protein